MQTTLGTPTVSAVFFFVLIVVMTLGVTWWAARRTRSTREFYAACNVSAAPSAVVRPYH
jgi:cation/acetate symporter